MATPPFHSTNDLVILSRLLLSERNSPLPALNDASADCEKCLRDLSASGKTEARVFLKLATSHHVIVRGLSRFHEMTDAAGREWPDWAANAAETEQARIEHALAFLKSICGTLDDAGCNVVVIKSLDHWPDLGSDLDLFTTAQPARIIALMKRHFHAQLAPRSWGDRLANKWNFLVPGLPESVEIHVGRLGQTGEQVEFANSVSARARAAQVGPHFFRVPAPEDRLVISALQRMYRHFYLRLCDIADTARLLETGTVDYDYLARSSGAAGLWKGLATYLLIVSDYVKQYRGYGIALPEFVISSAGFGGDQIYFKHGFLRVPIVPHSARFYAAELGRLALNKELRGTLRLSLLPGLATAAAVEMRLTGSDKGIW